MSTSTHDIRAELRALWRTRPVRTPDESKVAGVCGGIGRRYGIDPVLPRVVFVVATLWGGAGVFVYALCWLLLRSSGDQVSAGESLVGRGRSSGSKPLAIGLVAVVLLSAPTFGGSGEVYFMGAGVVMTLALLAGWYALHRRMPTPPAGWVEVSAVRPKTSRTNGGREPGVDPTAPYGPPAPPSWDPLGTAPFAWDLPEPGAAPDPETPDRTSRLTRTTLGLALIAVAVGIGLSTLFTITWLSVTTIAAIALAVIASGLLVGAATRTGHGLLVVAGPLAGFVLLASLVDPFTGTHGWGDAGDLRVSVADVAQLDTPILHEVGTVTVDMRDLELDRDRTYRISNDIGTIRVLLPRELDVIADCEADIGNVDCPVGADPGGDGPVLALDVRTTVGSVEVTR